MTQTLNTQIFGTETEHPTLLIAHGLFGSGRNWRAIAKRLSANRQVITVDMRNHGDSFWDASQTYHDMADDLEAVIASKNAPIDVSGHSMGGKAAMVLALRNPPNLNRLIVVDIAPVAYAHTQQSNIDVMKNIDITPLTRRSEADALMEPYIPDAPTRAFLLQSLEISEAENRWKLNLDALAENMDHIIGFPSINSAFSNPTIFIKGGNSDYIIDAHKPVMKDQFPNHSVETIPNAGHWVHAEAPREFIDSVSNFLNSSISS